MLPFDVTDLVVSALGLAVAAVLARELLISRRARRAIAEYERARRHYELIIRHRIANPLTAIRGAAQTLRREPGVDPFTRGLLIEAIVDASLELERVSFAPDAGRAEEKELHPVPLLAGDPL